MPLQKLQFKPGINRESTSYANEGGWFESEKIRFRSGQPEKIGGWTNLAAAVSGVAYTYAGVNRDMVNWVTLNYSNLNGVATNQKCYIEYGGHRVDYRMVVNKNSVSFLTDKGVFVGRTPSAVAQHHMATAPTSFKPWSGWCAIRLANHKNTPLCFFRDENM